jgi:hypothetical protein
MKKRHRLFGVAIAATRLNAQFDQQVSADKSDIGFSKVRLSDSANGNGLRRRRSCFGRLMTPRLQAAVMASKSRERLAPVISMKFGTGGTATGNLVHNCAVRSCVVVTTWAQMLSECRKCGPRRCERAGSVALRLKLRYFKPSKRRSPKRRESPQLFL